MTPPPLGPEGHNREESLAATPAGPEVRPEVVHLLEGYLERLEQGGPPRPEEWLAQYPELSGAPEEYLATLELLHQTALSLGSAPAPEPAPAAERPALGQLGDYRLLREVGRGGMGIVYEAEQSSLGRRVALKVLPLAGALDARQLQRFHNEALTASQLHHPHIVDVFGAGCESGIHYYAMRYIEGQTLAQLIDRLRKAAGVEAADGPEGEAGPLPATLPETDPAGRLTTEGAAPGRGHYRAAAEIGVQVAEALDYAHEHGVVHRDIKPSNVMLDTEGQAWVTDFGLAHLQRQAHLTQSGDLLGTLRYMSPEQALARRDMLDHRADVYALGATLYELLTLRPAVAGDDRQEVLRRVAFEEPARPSSLSPALPPDLEAVVLKAMARAPEERYGTALELAEDLRRFLNDQPVQARCPTRLQQACKWARRHCRALLGASVAAILVLTLAVVVLALSNDRLRLHSQEQQTRAAERERTLQLAQARWSEARASRRSGQPSQRLGGLGALAEATSHFRDLDLLNPLKKFELRNEAIACLGLPDVREVARRRLPVSRGVAFDSSCRHFAYPEGPGDMTVRRLEDGQVVRRFRWKGGMNRGCGFSPDDRFLAVQCREDGDLDRDPAICRVWDMADGRLVLERPMAALSGPSFRQDGKVLALPQPDGSVSLYDLSERQDLPPLPPGPLPAPVLFHPDNRHLAFCFVNRPGAVVWDLAARKVVTKLVGPPGRGGSLAWGPDGRLLAVGSLDTNIYLCAFPGGECQAVLRGHEHIVTCVAFHPSGHFLVSTSHDDTTRFWHLSGGAELVLAGEILCGLSRDGRLMATRSYHPTIATWEVSTPDSCLHSPAPGCERGGAQGKVAFARDGRLLAAAGRDGVLLWDAAAARPVGRVPSGPAHSLAFHPDGGRLFTTGPGGVTQWPIVPNGQGPALRVCPGQPLWSTTAAADSLRARIDRAGRWLILAENARDVNLLPLDGSGKAHRLGSHEGLCGVALSPDGAWAASAGGPDDTVCVWDVARGTLARRLPHGRNNYCAVTFSPDGRWLVTNVRSEFLVWEVGSWELKHRLPRHLRSLEGYVAFADDGRLLALASARNVVELYDPATWRHLATVKTPGRKDLTGLALSPDGSRLAATTADEALALWDLRRLRQELAALGLDWEMTPYPPAEPVAEAAWALTVEVLPAATGSR
jgi:serine/threonine protein kinase/WD40 repeat protein